MGPIMVFDSYVLRISAAISSTYISAIAVGSLTKDASKAVNEQALGFVTLFFISLLIYLVI